MQLKKTLSRTLLAITIAAPLYAGAHSWDDGPWQTPPLGNNDDQLQMLSLRSCLNGDLEGGSYVFSDYQRPGSGFHTTWSFSIAQSSDITISLNDLNQPSSPMGLLGNGSPLLDNQFLTTSLFDAEGNLLGTVGEGGSMSLTGLQANSWYTLAVSGKAAGQLGGLYYGAVELTAVPIGDTLPLLGSALAALAFVRHRKSRNKDLANQS